MYIRYYFQIFIYVHEGLEYDSFDNYRRKNFIDIELKKTQIRIIDNT